MLKKLICVSIIIGCAFIWAQDLSRPDVNVKKGDVSDVQSKSNIGVIKVEEVEPTDDGRGVHTRMNIQGYLTDDSNPPNPINGSVPITFSIYDAYSGGNLMWGPEVDTVYCSQGLFNYLIGGKLPINPSVFTGGTYRTLRMVINGQTMPPIIITSVGWAYSAGKSDSSDWAYNSDRLDGHHWSEVPNSADYIDEGQAAGGDLSGTYPNPTIAKIQGKTVSAANPPANYVLKYYNNAWQPRVDETGSLPGAGNGLYYSGSTLHVGQGTGISVSADAVAFNTSWGDGRYVNEGQAAGGDLSGTYPNPDIRIPCNLEGSSTSYILRVYNSSTGHALRAVSEGGYGVFGQSNTTDGVYGSGNDDGVTGYGNDNGIYGNGGDRGVVGYSTGSGSTNYGVYGQGGICGVSGYAYNSSGDRRGVRGNSNGGGWAYLGAQISGTNYKVYGVGNVSCVMPTREGNKVLFASECPEPYFEDFGQGQLINGHCHIELDPLFLDCIKTDTNHPMKVFVQLNDDCNGVYVKTGQTGFDVYELQNGTSNASFTYRVVANRKDTDYLRFPNAVIDEELEELEEEK